MKKTPETLRDPEEGDHLELLCNAMMLAKTSEEMQKFMSDLCTPSETKAMAERWHVAKILDRTSLSYRDIHDETGVSTTTVGRVARFLTNEPHQGYRTILNRLNREKNNGTDTTKNSSTKERQIG